MVWTEIHYSVVWAEIHYACLDTSASQILNNLNIDVIFSSRLMLFVLHLSDKWNTCYLRILLSNTISISDDVRIVKQLHDRCHKWSKKWYPLEHMSSPPVFSGVRVALSLVSFCVVFCPFSFRHCVVCPSNYGFWLPLWYRHTRSIKRLGHGKHLQLYDHITQAGYCYWSVSTNRSKPGK